MSSQSFTRYRQVSCTPDRAKQLLELFLSTDETAKRITTWSVAGVQGILMYYDTDGHLCGRVVDSLAERLGI